jgi:hypothetical protein
VIRALAAVLLMLGPAAAFGQAPAVATKKFDTITLDDVLGAVRNRTNMTFGADGTAPPIKRYDSSGKLTSSTPAQPMKGTGTQIEYLGADGKAYLWYPGNPNLMVGEWKTGTVPLIRNNNGVENRSEMPTLCFRYGSQGFSCDGAYTYLRRVTDSAPGDVFGLSRRSKPPFVLDRERTTIETLKKKTGT